MKAKSSCCPFETYHMYESSDFATLEFFALKNILVSLAKRDSSEVHYPATAVFNE